MAHVFSHILILHILCKIQHSKCLLMKNKTMQFICIFPLFCSDFLAQNVANKIQLCSSISANRWRELVLFCQVQTVKYPRKAVHRIICHTIYPYQPRITYKQTLNPIITPLLASFDLHSNSIMH